MPVGFARLYPSGVGVINAWTAEGALSKAEEVNQPSFSDGSAEAGEKGNGTAPTNLTTRGLKNSTKGGNQSLNFVKEAEEKLPSGCTIKRAWVHYYLSVISSAKLKVELQVSTSTPAEVFEVGSTTAEWRRWKVTAEKTEKLTRAEIIAANTMLRFTNEKEKSESVLNNCYLEVEYEYENAVKPLAMVV